MLGRRVRGDHGASAVEYGLMIAGIAAVIMVIVFTLGTSIRDTLFGTSCTAIQGEIGGDVEECT